MKAVFEQGHFGNWTLVRIPYHAAEWGQALSKFGAQTGNETRHRNAPRKHNATPAASTAEPWQST